MGKLMASIFFIDGKLAHWTIKQHSYKTIDEVYKQRLNKGIVNILIKRRYKTIKVEWREQKTESPEQFIRESLKWVAEQIFHPLFNCLELKKPDSGLNSNMEHK